MLASASRDAVAQRYSWRCNDDNEDTEKGPDKSDPFGLKGNDRLRGEIGFENAASLTCNMEHSPVCFIDKPSGALRADNHRRCNKPNRGLFHASVTGKSLCRAPPLSSADST